VTIGLLAGGGKVDNKEPVQCDRPGCDEWFVKKTHNQRYHNDECCRIATNAKIMEKYYERRDIKNGIARTCKACNVTKLSRYNDSQTCAACTSKRETDVNSSVLNMLTSANLA
jgi:hypothetical protein